eukprot:CAMPEP_0194176360 /NCGR_PEP_ID=MMETSP0154-20130528/10275_1 /TAXON_ID=1049557 /ORGANISM="Thalassiothrix antarctica, Strain L6-D1" /LENGTH=123 /DNA_ID=CAMNT_0038890495 /DNA_START=376 /DNA_END=744 /DNA_ORIENTATION=+
MGKDLAIIVGGAQKHLKLNLFKPLIVAKLLRSARLYAILVNPSPANDLMIWRSTGIKLMNASMMLVTALNPHIGYDNAKEIAKMAHKNGTTPKESSVPSGYLITRHFDEWIVPSKIFELTKKQ